MSHQAGQLQLVAFAGLDSVYFVVGLVVVVVVVVVIAVVDVVVAVAVDTVEGTPVVVVVLSSAGGPGSLAVPAAVSDQMDTSCEHMSAVV